MSDRNLNVTITDKPAFGIDAFTLKMIAIAAMLLDHMWATIISGNTWMTCVGRIAFPIFAFQIVEGFFHTSNLRKYMLRMLLFAFISEIPFNMMVAGGIIFPFHQNVIFTLLIGLVSISIIDKAKQTKSKPKFIAISLAVIILSCALATISFVDYMFQGVLMIYIFYFFRNIKFFRLYQLAGLFIVNYFFLAGYSYIIPFFDSEIEIPQQTFAIFALIPIWLYNGKKGLSSKPAQYAFYIFYPLHMLILSLILKYR